MRTLKVKQIVLAVAAALVVAPAFAATYTPADVPGATRVILSGATAPDGFIKGAAADMLAPGFKSYRNKDLTQAFQFRAWFGAAKAGIPGVTAGTHILVVKRSKGGSVWGVDPVARASRIQSLDFTDCTVGGTVVIGGRTEDTYDYFCGVKGLDPDSPNFRNAALNNGDVSDFGVSDVSPILFKAPFNVEFGQAQLNATELAALTIKPVNALMMGIVATNDVPATTRISRSDYSNMLTGNVQDWSQIDASLTSGNTQVVVCRRVDGSGTQASYNWFFNNFPCQSAFGGQLAPASMTSDSASGIVSGSGTVASPFVIDPTVGYTVVNNSTSGDVRNCLIRANTRTDHTITGDDGKTYKIQFSNSVVPFKAIGTLSVDSYNATGTGSGEGTDWRFRMMDGAGTYIPGTQTASAGATGTAPSKANLLSGAYDFAVELTMQYRNKTVVNPQGDSIGALVGVKKAFADELIKRSGDPAKIAINSKANAYAALPDFYDQTASATNTAHVAVGSHGGNMCKPLKRLY